MKKLILITAMCCVVFFMGGLHAQSITVTATAGVVGPTNYSNLGAAFTAINGGTHQGAITIDVIANSLELTPAVLNSSGAGSATYTSVLIRPASDAIVITGATAAGRGVIELKGADNVTIDGDNPNTAGINKNLGIYNSASATTNYTSAIRICPVNSGQAISADNITLQNLAVIGSAANRNASANTSTTGSENTTFGIVVGNNGGSTDVDVPTAMTSVTGNTPAGTTVNNFIVSNCSIVSCARGIAFIGNATATSTGVTFTNNQVGDQATTLTGVPPYTGPQTTVYTKGIYVQGTNAVTITGNTIKNILSYVSTGMSAIELNSAIGSGTISISNNTITGVCQNNASNAPRAILISSAGGAYTISNNNISRIHMLGATSYGAVEIAAGTGSITQNNITDIKHYNTSAYGVYAINLNGGNNHVVSNNFISDLNAYSNNTVTGTTFQPVGIRINAGTGHKIYYNSIHFTGGPLGGTGANGTSAVMIVSSSYTGLDIRNNILSNQFSGWPAGSVHACIFLPSGMSSSFNSIINNNAYYAGTGNFVSQLSSGTTYTAANFNPLATTPANNFRSYSNGLNGSATNDNASFASNVAPPFISNTNLHINNLAVNASALDGKAVTIAGITADIDGDVRNVTTPDIGADEFTLPACTSSNGGTITPATYTRCAGQTVSLTSTGFSTGLGITYQWKVSNTSGGPYVNVTGGSGATTTSYTSAALTAGTYYYVLEVTCSTGPSTGLSSEATVTVNPPPAISVTPSAGSICTTSPTPVPLSASGPSTSYTWAPAAGLSATTGANVTATPTGTTTYTVTGTDASSCSNSTTVVITISSNPTLSSVTATPAAVCAGGNSQLQANVTFTQEYEINRITYALSPTPGAGVTTLANAGTQVVATAGGGLDDDGWPNIALPFGFNFFGTTYNTCAISTNGFIVFGPGAPNTYSGYANTFPATAAGRPSIGAVYADLTFVPVSGGTIEYFTLGTAPNRIFVINWKNGQYYLGSGTGQGSVNTQIKLYEGTNVVEVHTTNATGEKASVEGIQNAAGTVAHTVGGRNNTNFVISSPEAYRWSKPTATYAWSPATYLTSTTIANPMANAITSSTTYTVSVTNGACAGSTNTVSISAGTALSSTALTSNAPLCNGTDLIITAHPVGGGAPYNFSWTVDGGAPFSSPFATDTITLAIGNHTIESTVTDACGATTIQSTSVTVNAVPTATASVVSPACVGNTVNFTGTTDIGTTYSWTGPNSFTSNLLSPSIPSVTTAASGTYSLTISANGCSAPLATASLTVNPTPSGVTATATNDTICEGGTIDLNAPFSATLTLLSENFNAGAPAWTRINNSTGGTPALAAWTDQLDGYTYTSSPAVTFHSNDNSQFVITNADPQGSGSVSRTFLVSPTFSTVGLATCSLSFYHSYRDVSITQPNDSGTVQISLDGVTWNNLQMYNSDQPATHGQFAAVNINLNAYVNNPNVRIRFNYYSTWDWWWAIDNVVVNGTASTPSFAWTSTPSGFTSSLQNPTGVAPTTNTTYIVTATNTFGCTASATTSVVVNPTPTVGVSATDMSICAGGSTDLTGSGAATYTWMPGSLSGTTVTVTPAATTTYTVTGTTANGCSNTNTITITTTALPVVTANATDTTLCPSQSTTLTGGGAVSYVWTGGVTDGVAFTPASTATYTVTGTDANTCSNTASITVTVNAVPSISYTSTPNDTVCIGSSVTLAGTGGVSYTWTGSITDATPFTVAASATYTVTGTDANGCSNTATATVTANPLPSVGSSAAPSTTVCNGANVTLSGTGATTYTWSGGITDAVPFAATTSTTYTVTGTDAFGCSNTNTTSITVNPLPTIGYTAAPNDTVCSGTTVTLNGTGGVSYTWTGGITNGVGFPANTTATYTVTGTDANTCTSTATATVVVNPIPVVNLGPDVVQANPPAVLDAGAGFDSYLWNTSPAQTTQTISVNTNGTYIVTVTDNGCTDSDTIQVFFTAGVMGEGEGFASVKLYPNPSDGAFNVSIDNLETENLVMEIMDMTGRTVYNHVAGSVSGNIIVPFSLNELRVGTYILRLQANAKTTQLRFVVNK